MMYDRGPPEQAQVVCEWDGGRTWIAHPDEPGQRASHAIRTAQGVWIIDPLDATNLETILSPLGEVTGVAVCSAWHARDAGAVARRYDVSVHIPTWMGRVAKRVEAPIERYGLTPNPAFRTIACRPLPGWQEIFLYHDATHTLVIPDSLGTVPHWTLGDERLGLPMFRDLQPPIQLRGLEPARILVGHGEPIISDAPTVLAEALSGGRRRFVRSAIHNGADTLRGVVSVLRD